jgi:uncharacterized membrane protein YidH (DUF202 family)
MSLSIGDSQSYCLSTLISISPTPFHQFNIYSVSLFTTYDSSESRMKRTTIATTLFIHATLFLFPAVAIALPTASSNSWGNSLFTGFSIVFNTWLALFLAVLQFWPQFLEYRRRSGAPGVLSLLMLGIQAIVLIVLAGRWLQRLGPTTWGSQLVPFWYWFQWGWLPFIYLIYGIVYACLLALYLLDGRGRDSTRVGIVREETPYSRLA